MATVNQIVDEYVLRTRIEDEATQQAAAAAEAFDRMQQSARDAADAVKDLGNASSDGKITKATPEFDKIAARVDDVTRAYNAMRLAQTRLQEGQAAAARELERDPGRYEEVNRVLAALAQRVEDAANKWGDLRAKAEENHAAVESWNGVLQETNGNLETFAARVAASATASKLAADAAGAAAEAQSYYNNLIQGQAAPKIDTTEFDLSGKAFKSAAESAEVFAASIDKARAQFGPLGTALDQYKESIAAVEQAESRGILTTEEAVGVLDRLGSAYDQTTDRADRAAAAVAKAAEAAAANAQSYYNSLVQNQGSSTGGDAEATDLTGRAFKSAAESADAFSASITKVRAAYVPLEALQNKYKDTIATINAAEAQGVLTTNEAAAARVRETVTYNDAYQNLNKLSDGMTNSSQGSSAAAKGFANAAQAARLMGIQVIQTFSGFATGQPILTTLIQQVHQMADIALAQGQSFEQVLESFKKMGTGMVSVAGRIVAAMGPVGIAIAVVTAAFAIGAIVAYNHQAKLIDLQNTLRGTRADFVAAAASVDVMSRSLAATSDIKTSEAFAAMSKFANSSNVINQSSDYIKKLTSAAKDLSLVWGVDVPQAADKLVKALSNPTTAAKALVDEGFGGMTASLARMIERMQQSGNLLGAQEVLLNRLKAASDGAAQSHTSLGAAWEKLKQAMSSAYEGGKPFIEMLGGSLLDSLARDILQFTVLITKIKELAEALKNGTVSQLFGLSSNNNASNPATGVASNDNFTGYTYGYPAIQNSIKNASNEFGMDANYVSALQYSENAKPTGVDSQGNLTWARSSTGAYGAMQVFQGAATEAMTKYPQLQGLDWQNNTDANIRVGTAYLSIQRQATNSAYDAVLMYHLGAGGYNQFQNNNTNTLTTAQADAVKQAVQVTTIYGGGSGLLRSGVSSTTGAATDAEVAQSLKDLDSTVEKWRQEQGSSSSRVQQTDYERTLTEANSASTLPVTQQNLSDMIQRYSAAQTTARGILTNLQNTGADNDTIKQASADYEVLTAKLNQLKGAQNDAISQGQLYTRTLQDQLPAASAMTEGERVLAEVTQQLNEKERSLPGSVSAADRANAITAALNLQDAALKKEIYNIELSVASEDKLSAAYQTGYTAVALATANNEAYLKSIQRFAPGTDDQKKAEAALTVEIYKNNDAKASAANYAKALQENLDTKYIDAETSSLGRNFEERSIYLNQLKVAQVAEQEGKDILDESIQARLRSVTALTQSTLAYKNAENALNELSNFTDSAFSNISSKIADSFSLTEKNVLRIKDIASSVITSLVSEFLKLAAINPFKNWLFGQNNVTLDSVGGLLGSLFGNSSVSTTSTASGVSTLESLGLFTGVSGLSASALASANNASSGTSGGSTVGVGTVGTGLSALDNVAGTGVVDKLSGYIVDGIKSAFGTTEVTSDIAASVSETGQAGIATTLGASAGQALGLSEEGISSLASAAATVADAIPYIGAAISVITDVISGNYLSAGTTLAGAAIGTVIAPGIGTAVGAVLGNLLGGFLGGHAENSYQGTEVTTTADGRLGIGRSLAQVQSADSTVSSLKSWETQFNSFLDSTKVKLEYIVGDTADIGTGIKNVTQYSSIADAFKNFRFVNDPSDTSNFGVAKGALHTMSFASVADFSTELTKIAGFADAATALGITLRSVDTDLTNIQISSVAGAGQGNDLRTALNADLPTQTFANVQALDDEITKVNQFVNGTLPGLLNPVEKTTSSTLTQLQTLQDQYGAALVQAEAYGLDYAQRLGDAYNKAQAMVLKSAIESIQSTMTQEFDTFMLSHGGAPATYQQTVDTSYTSAQAKLQAFIQSWKETFGDAIVYTDGFTNSVALYAQEVGGEFNSAVQAATEALAAAYSSLADTVYGYYERLYKATGNNEASDLLAYDVKSRQENESLTAQFKAYYGDAYSTQADYLNAMSVADQVHYQERLAIQRQYGDAAAGATADQIKSAQASVISLFTNLKSYVHGLETGSSSPLSPTAQYDQAKSQFNAVAGAAAAGDATSAGELSGYADTLLSTSRAVYGSGTNYVADFNRVLDAIQAVVTQPTDQLTQSFLALQLQTQTTSIVNSIQSLQDEVAALRREMAAQTRLSALAA